MRLRDKDNKVTLQFNKYHFSFLGDADPESNDLKYPVLLMESVHKISQDFPSVLNDEDRKKLAGIMQKLGFDDLVPLFYEMPLDHERKVNKYHSTSTIQSLQVAQNNVVLTVLLSLYFKRLFGLCFM